MKPSATEAWGIKRKQREKLVEERENSAVERGGGGLGGLKENRIALV